MMMKRRDFLRMATGTAAILATPAAFALPVSSDERILRFNNLHTGESLKATYWADGDYISEGLSAVEQLLRDHRSDEVGTIDRKLLDMLYSLQQQVGKPEPFHVISGYRSPSSNAKLYRTTSGVAKRSLHMQGKAIDIRLPGVQLDKLRRAAIALRAGGVGYYPDSNFIHVDTGQPRHW
jgi:uncharacterized protein YcbK (DUF882 family)